MALIVQKFGGTSVADVQGRHHLVSKVKQAIEDGDQVVVVVSAMGRKGAPYATDTLLDLLHEFDAAPDALTRDLLVSCGETISASLISALLKREGLRSIPMTAYTMGLRAMGPYGDAFPTEVDSQTILSHLKAGIIPVATGYQALSDSNNITTLGRGGSDTSAVAIGIALKAAFVDIYTDVPGVAKADPRVVPEAGFLDFLDYDSMSRLAKHGAKVLHHRSATLAELSKTLLRVRSTAGDQVGTLIGPEGYSGEEGRFRSVPDFIGLAAMPIEDNVHRITAIFAKGKGRRGIGDALKAAENMGISQEILDDSDAIAFRCDQSQVTVVMRELYSVLC